ncbi:MAG: hypothetical protein KDD36_13485 [Flavobacteriales bacterium]|nr:hypothetical protein [Flavobacteriales bacterium]
MSLTFGSSCHSGKKATGDAVSQSTEDTPQPDGDIKVKDKMVEDEDSLFASISRSPCFGRCPEYDLRIYRSGYTIYDAKRFTDTVGVFYTILPREKLDKIKEYANEIGYFEMEDSYDNQYVTDIPGVDTRCHFDGKDKSIHNRYQGPRELSSFEKFLDDQVKDVEWKLLKRPQD